jgi:hypothetical protein
VTYKRELERAADSKRLELDTAKATVKLALVNYRRLENVVADYDRAIANYTDETPSI